MDPRKVSAQELIKLCLASHDEALWLEFVHRFQPLIAGVVAKSVRRWTTPQPSLIDDLVQETYLRICANNFKALREFEYEHDNALFGFFKVVASNVVQDHFRSSYSQKRGSGREDETLETVGATTFAPGGFVEHADRQILLGEIAQCLNGQSADPNFSRDSAIFWLYFRHGLTAKAIAQFPAIGLTVKGVESTLLRLTRMIRGKLSERPPSRGMAAGQ